MRFREKMREAKMQRRRGNKKEGRGRAELPFAAAA